MKSASAKLNTNLVGRKVHLITDEEVREEARKQENALDPEILKTLTAEAWFPAMKQYRQRFGSQIGEIVTVHLANEGYLVYTVAFGGQLVELNKELWRLNVQESA